MDTISFLQPEISLQVIDQQYSLYISADALQIFDVLLVETDRVMAVEPESDMLHVIEDDIGILGHTACKNPNFEVLRHLLEELKHVGPDEELSLHIFYLVVDESFV